MQREKRGKDQPPIYRNGKECTYDGAEVLSRMYLVNDMFFPRRIAGRKQLF
jgi:hypothetical protein